MVLLTMTATIVEALQTLHEAETSHSHEELAQLSSQQQMGKEIEGSILTTSQENEAQLSKKDKETGGEERDVKATEDSDPTDLPVQQDVPTLSSGDSKSVGNAKVSQEPLLANPKIGNPISHGQIIDLWRDIKKQNISSLTLELLLRGSRVYVPPPVPKAEPTSEYKALMARLRREEEARTYERMINPPPPMETFAQIFPSASAAHAFSANFSEPGNSEDDDVTYADIDRQIAVIFNVIVSIVACAFGLWMAARWWSTPARLALSMSGSLLVGIAEVVVYMGYIRRVGEAKGQAKKLLEVKEVMKTWVVGGDAKVEQVEPVMLVEKDDNEDAKPRRRKNI
ncbi:a3ed1b55-7719-480b-8297-f2176f8e3d39 [Sclerotinia trifoliorum]|uniref:A3ed1b55-7719-480b-8297-f2176f8e3d39 n=1 Tax=Sclerotinia trifoliorum TaxID=28548 RepID=A0A8H2VQH3_9HELO|nr:a3ed1b55-7719-480b-8297-f2176f8e3d39 [Sclerotinia trifoliorum]